MDRRAATIDEVAAALGVERRTVERGISAGTIPSVQVSGRKGRVLIPMAWLDEQFPEPAPPVPPAGESAPARSAGGSS